jgi:hypothetical protein
MAAGLACPAVSVAESTARFWKKRSLLEIPCSAWVSHLNTTFRFVAAAGGTIKVTLTEVKMRPQRLLPPDRRPLPDAGLEQFSLFFSGARSDLLTQDIYTVAHETLGSFDVVLVPIYTRNPAKIDYQAVISRPRQHATSENQTQG